MFFFKYLNLYITVANDLRISPAEAFHPSMSAIYGPLVLETAWWMLVVGIPTPLKNSQLMSVGIMTFPIYATNIHIYIPSGYD